jgi:hypothetical protein
MKLKALIILLIFYKFSIIAGAPTCVTNVIDPQDVLDWTTTGGYNSNLIYNCVEQSTPFFGGIGVFGSGSIS